MALVVGSVKVESLTPVPELLSVLLLHAIINKMFNRNGNEIFIAFMFFILQIQTLFHNFLQ